MIHCVVFVRINCHFEYLLCHISRLKRTSEIRLGNEMNSSLPQNDPWRNKSDNLPVFTREVNCSRRVSLLFCKLHSQTNRNPFLFLKSPHCCVAFRVDSGKEQFSFQGLRQISFWLCVASTLCADSKTFCNLSGVNCWTFRCFHDSAWHR